MSLKDIASLEFMVASRILMIYAKSGGANMFVMIRRQKTIERSYIFSKECLKFFHCQL
jgi:hypothetical protein